MEYEILNANYIPELVQKVQQYISQGWRPLGGVAVEAGQNFRGEWFAIYYQAMIRG